MKINWTKLRKSAKETAFTMIAGFVMVAMVGLPVFLCLVTESLWFLILYPIAFFIENTWENYNGR